MPPGSGRSATRSWSFGRRAVWRSASRPGAATRSRCATTSPTSSTRSASTCRRTAHDAEVAFWTELTGWTRADSEEPELSFLRRPAGIPLRVLFQRLDEPTGPVRAHADIACVDRAATLARHLAAGATVVRERQQWTVLADPVGRVYCLTDRSPTRPAGQ